MGIVIGYSEHSSLEQAVADVRFPGGKHEPQDGPVLRIVLF